MRNILIVGIGTGNPEHLTVQAINALNAAAVLFIPTKGEAKAQLAEIRRDIVSRYVTRRDRRVVEFEVPLRQIAGRSYPQSVDAWHAAIAATYERLLLDVLAEGETGVFHVWGDTKLYDSTIRINERVRAFDTVKFE